MENKVIIGGIYNISSYGTIGVAIKENDSCISMYILNSLTDDV